MSITVATHTYRLAKFSDEAECLDQARAWLLEIDLRLHRSNPEFKAAVHAARAAVLGAEDALAAVERGA